MMLRRLALALSLSTAIVAAGAGTATAGPAIAAIGAFAATPIGGVVVNAAVGLAFSGGAALIDHLTNPPQERPGARPVAGYSGTVPNDPVAPIGFTMGKKAIAGTITYRGSWGNTGQVQNAFYVEERVLSDVPLGDDPGPSHIVIGKKRYAIDWDAVPAAQGYPIPGLNRDGKDHGWVRFYNGDQTVASTYMRNKFGDHPDQPYTAGMVGRGQAKMVATFRVNAKVFKTGFPQWKVDTVGICMYNIAKDTTAGGSGAHRIDDPSTWEPSSLLPVHLFNGLYGVRYGDEWVWGGQDTAASQLPASSWIAAIAEAGTSVDKKGGGTELQYVGGMEIAGDMEPASVFEHQLRGCSGRFAEIGGIYKMICGLPASPVFSFSDNSVIISRAQQFEPFPRPEATYNAILAKYWEPSGGWQLKDVPELKNDDWIAEDGGYRPANVTYEAVNSGTQAQRLNFEAAEDSRRWRIHSLPLLPLASELEPLDMVAYSSGYWGYDGKTFLVEGIDDEETFEQLVTLREVDPADHGGYDPDVDEQDMVFPTLDLAPPDPVVMAGYQVFADVITGDNGTQRPKIRLRIPGGLDDVASISVTVRRTSDSSHVWSGVQDYVQGLADGSTYDRLLAAEVLAATAYQVEANEIPGPGSRRDTVSSGWLDVTTSDITLTYLDFDPTIRARMDFLTQSIAQHRKSFEETVLRVKDLSQNVAGAWQEMNRHIEVIRGNDRAYFDEQISLGIAYTDAGVNAVAAQVAALGLIVNDPTSGLGATASSLSATILTVNGQGSTLTSHGSRLDALELTVGGVIAGATWFTEVNATPEFGWASTGFGAYASDGTTKGQAAFYVEAKSDGTGRGVFVGQRMNFADASGNIYAMFDATGAYFNAVRVIELTADNLKLRGSGGYVGIDADAYLKLTSISTQVIGTNQVTVGGADVEASDTNITGTAENPSLPTAWTTISSFSLTPNGGEVLIIASTDIFARTNTAGSDGRVEVGIFNNSTSTTVPRVSRQRDYDVGAFEHADVTLMWRETSVGTSSRTYALKVRCVAGGGGGTGACNSCTAREGSGIMAWNFKK